MLNIDDSQSIKIAIFLIISFVIIHFLFVFSLNAILLFSLLMSNGHSYYIQWMNLFGYSIK